jgi:hypothetical protein
MYIHSLDLVVGERQTELANTGLDGIPTGKARCKVHVASHAKIGGVDDFVRARIVEDGLGVDAGLVGEGAEAGDGVVADGRHMSEYWPTDRAGRVTLDLQWNVNLDLFGDHVLNLLELVQLVLAHDIVAVGNNHARHQATKRL